MKLKIEEVLEQKGVTSAELARRMGVSRSSMHNTIKKGNPNLDTLQSIARALEVDVIDLFDTGKKELTALIDHNGTMHRFDNVEALKGFISRVEEER